MLFRADELFDISADANAAFPLNLEFIIKDSNKKELQGSGIYFMTYKGELIYIGFADKQDALLRMKMQLEGVTLRGKNVAFRKNSVDAIRNSHILKHFFNPSILRENGYETTPKRILFAENHWKDFAYLDEYVLNNFAFDWFAVENNVAERCELLKDKFHPRCNSQGFLTKDYPMELKSISNKF
jgi:hypothetical protein